MAKNVIINGVTYSNVPSVTIPLAAGSGDAEFFDTSDANAAAGDIRSGKTGYVNGTKVNGSVLTKTASDLTVNGATVTVPAGIYDSSASKSVASGSVSEHASVAGGVIGSTASDYPVTATASGTVTAGYVSSNPTNATETKYVQVEEKSATPTTSAQEITPSSGKLLKKVTVNAVVVGGDATEADVMAGKTFLSAGSLTLKTGNATVPTVSQNTTTKVLTIA